MGEADSVGKEFLDKYWPMNNVIPLGQLSPKDVDCVVIPGGHGPVFDLATDKACIDFFEKVFENRGIVAAVCHGPVALVNVQIKSHKVGHPKTWLVQGRRLTGFSNAEEREVGMEEQVPFLLERELVHRGAHYSKAGNGRAMSFRMETCWRDRILFLPNHLLMPSLKL